MVGLWRFPGFSLTPMGMLEEEKEEDRMEARGRGVHRGEGRKEGYRDYADGSMLLAGVLAEVCGM